jgi:DeoR/GlpR family transcriptional regulator of sugar metabolism
MKLSPVNSETSLSSHEKSGAFRLYNRGQGVDVGAVRETVGLAGDGVGGSRNEKMVRRQGLMTEYLLERGSVPIKELAREFDVSLITIHRDLDELERQGVLMKLRGRVTAQPSSFFDSNVRYRLRAAQREKEALARFALGQIEPGQSVMLDESTTALVLAGMLPEKAPLTVITNFSMILDELDGVRGIDLILLGGQYLPALDAFGGAVCEAALSALRADVLFMSTSAVSDCLALHQDQEIMRGKRAMMNSSKRRVLLVDHTKFDKVALHRLAHLRDFDLLVTDAGIDGSALDELQENSIHFEVAPL